MKRFLLFLFLPSLVFAQGMREPQIDIQRKMKECTELVDRACEHFAKNPLNYSCRTFQKDKKKWRKGEITIFVIGHDGVVYVNDRRQSIWHDFYDERAGSPDSFVKLMIDQGEAGGWVNYEWNHGLQRAYVRNITKDGIKYIIGAGFYPESGEFITEQLAHSAIRSLKTKGAKDTFDRISNPIGQFVHGSIYLYVYDTQGNLLAHGQDIARIGQNFWDWQDSEGRYRVRNMLELAMKGEGKGWFEYNDRGVFKRAYYERVLDPVTKKEYVFGGGYYPTVTEDTIRSLVKQGVAFLKANPKDIAFRDFSSHSGGFRKGPFGLFVYDLNGVLRADAEHPEFIGQNLMGSKDAEGKPIAKRIIDQARANNKGWVSFVDRSAYKDAYIELVRIPDGEFIIGAGYWPASKPRAVQSLVEKALSYMKSHTIDESLHMFTLDDSDFVRGDIHITIYDDKGICWGSGIDRHRIWDDDSKLADDKGKSIVNQLSTVATTGGGWILYPHFNAMRRVYVKAIEIEKPHAEKVAGMPEAMAEELAPQVFIVASGYFL